MPIEMPRVGLGTYTDDDQEGRYDAVRTALDVGYRHVDTAESYDNEQYVGAAIADADVAREDVFLATKTVNGDVPGSPDGVRDAIEARLERLGTDYLDLLYVHWPAGAYAEDPEATLTAYQDAVEDGLVEHVGVSNFAPEQLAEAREILDVPIAAHQFEMHPLLPQEELRADAREHDYWAVAYSPLAQGRVADLDPVVDAADAHDASPYQVALAWLLAKENVAAVPRASGREHIADNFGALDLDLTDEEVAAIDAVEERHRIIDPDFAPWN